MYYLLMHLFIYLFFHLFIYLCTDTEVVRTTVDAMTQGDLSNLDMKVSLLTTRPAQLALLIH